MLAFGEPFSFTPWGIVSACFWVPSGVAAIAGIKMAGLAVAMGTLSSFIVLVSFVWGIFVFDERIHSREIACLAIFLMMVGLCGMSYYSSLKQASVVEEEQANQQSISEIERGTAGEEGAYRLLAEENANEAGTGSQNGEIVDDSSDASETGEIRVQEPLLVDQTDNENDNLPSNAETSTATIDLDGTNGEFVIICGRRWPRRTVGIACSVFCGVWGGSIMAPEKLAKANTSGVGYLISFAIGAVIVTTALWMFRFSYHWARLGSAADAYQALPSFHIRVMWLPGCTAGTLWSIGNFFSLISVKYLGEGKSPIYSVPFPGYSRPTKTSERYDSNHCFGPFENEKGVGYSVTQSAMLGKSNTIPRTVCLKIVTFVVSQNCFPFSGAVSGLWGIFYFKEVTGVDAITKWLLSACLTISGILLLSYEHHEK